MKEASRECIIESDNERIIAEFKLKQDPQTGDESIFISGEPLTIEQAIKRLGESQFFNCMSEVAEKIKEA